MSSSPLHPHVSPEILRCQLIRCPNHHYQAIGLDGLKDLPRPGRPRRISAADRAAVVALACQLPAVTGVPLARWTGPELHAGITAGLAGGTMSLSSLRQILADRPIKPWQYQSWIFPRDPHFEARAKDQRPPPADPTHP
jgi:Homeodomain-like domain